jgi:hypothetical protein
LALLLITGAFFPEVGGFAGKGMGFRLPLFLAPSFVVPLIAWRTGKWNVPVDVALTIPFLLDTLGNAFGFFDDYGITDDVLHVVNWIVLCWGLASALAERNPHDRALVMIAGAGIGAMASIGWETAEYLIMRNGVIGMHLTYGDTIGDLVASSSGGALGTAIAVFGPGIKHSDRGHSG